MHHRLLTIIVSFFVITFLVLAPYALAATTIEVDKTGTVSTVIDGSSFTLSSGETMKLAAIDTPSAGAVGYDSSKNYLTGMIQGKTVYLDVDTVIVIDEGRLLCVVYLDFNSTHYENVNKAMVQNGYATPNSTSNTGFNPATWSWFVSKQTPTASPAAVATEAPTASPSPTPFSAPTPSVIPSVSEPSATETVTPTAYADATLPTSIVLLLIGITTSVIIAQLYRRRKK